MSTALDSLINEPLQWMLAGHGDGYALGWRGPREYIQKAHTLFVNFYDPPDHAHTPPLLEIHDALAYIYLPGPEAIAKTLKLFFYAEALRNHDVRVIKRWEGDELVYEWDEVGAERLATEDTATFMKRIKVRTFMPTPPTPHDGEYWLGRQVVEERSGVEELASTE